MKGTAWRADGASRGSAKGTEAFVFQQLCASLVTSCELQARVSWSEDISKVLLLSMLEIVSLNTKHMTGDYKFSFILTQLIAPVC